jgi:hypothetical protein
MKKLKTKYPNWFSSYRPPTLFDKKPQEMISENKTLSEESIKDFPHTIEATEDYKIVLDVDLDYSGCYYEGDHPSVKATIAKISKSIIPNPNYKKELDKYEKAFAENKREKEEWKKWKKIWDEEEAEKIKLRDLRMLKILKEKYEK